MLTGPRGGRARCVDGGVSVVCVRCHGVSPFWARIRWAGPRVRVYAHTDPVLGAPQAVCSQGASAAHLLLVLPGPRPRRVLPASTPGQGCRFGVWRLGSDGARSADGCGESRCAQGVGSSRNGVSSGLRVSPSPSVVGVSWVSVCHRCLRGVRLLSVSHGCPSTGLSFFLDVCRRCLTGVRLSSVSQGCLRAGLSVSLDICRRCLRGVRGQGCPSDRTELPKEADGRVRGSQRSWEDGGPGDVG